MKKVIIIGAGIAGLSAGCYLQMNGYETEILEKHIIPGGLCTSWERSGYCFDGCIHWLMGSSKANTYYQRWSELINMEDITFINHDTRVVIEMNEHADKYGNRMFYLYSDVDRLEKYMMDLSPEDKEVILSFTNAIRRIGRYPLPPLMEKTGEIMSLIRATPFLIHWSRITNTAFAKRFQSPFIREAFQLLYEGREYSLIAMILQMSFYGTGCAGYPQGGSLRFSKKLEERYLKLGGKIEYNRCVRKILVKDDKAVGVTTSDGVKMDSDLVISAADWRFTVFDALEGRYVGKTERELKERKRLEVFESALLISLGVDEVLTDYPHLIRFPLGEEWILPDGTRIDRMEANIFHYDETMSPQGKTSIVVTIPTNQAEYWITLRKSNYKEYQRVKNTISEKVLESLNRKIPGLKEKTEIVDVSTPATFERYTGNWLGSMQGWMPGEKMLSKAGIKNSLKGLKSFYMTGQWMIPGGGIPVALDTSRKLAKTICKRDHKKFKLI